MTSASKTSRDAKPARASRKAATKSPVRKATRRSGSSQAPVEAPPPPSATGGGGGIGSGVMRASVRVYCQGLGDCILVQVKSKNADDFKLLIDCGVVLGTEDAIRKMTEVVENVVHDTDGKIDVLAITHEHWDHLSGFNQAADSFKKLSVGSVWVAWTEDLNDDLAKQLKSELGKAETALAACASAFHAAGDRGATVDMLSDIALTPMGAAAASNTSTRAAFDKAKAMAGVKTWLPTEDPFEIPGTNARIYVLGPPHDPKLIRKINPSASSPETYGLSADGCAVLPLGVVAALGLSDHDDSLAPFHQRVTIPLRDQGGLSSLKERDPEGRLQKFFTEHYYGSDAWRRIDGDWLDPAAELALALQSYTNNTSLVLALELGDIGKGDVLLFAADAQVGNWESWQTWQWPKDAPKVTGPDLLKRTIFYKVGHHGSHNATLKEHGVEQMDALKAAIVPVDEKEALKKRWGRMPLPDLIAALKAKASPGMVLRTDQKPADPPDNVVIGDNYFEVRL
jgi:metallo-beta-lactamase superfamily protein